MTGHDVPNKPEQRSSLVDNHSAVMTETTSEGFNIKDHSPPQIEIKLITKLELPPAKNRADWKNIDNDLVKICAETLVDDDVENGLDKFESVVSDYLQSRFSKPEGPKHHYIAKKEDGETRHIRMMKRLSSKELRKAQRCGDNEKIQSAKLEYIRLVRLHNKCRRNWLQKRKKKDARKEQQMFKKNPYEFSKKLLDENINGEPSFTKEDANKYFPDEYSDRNRNFMFEPFNGLPIPPPPTDPFNMDIMNYEEFELKIKSRRNKSSPGPNGVPYLVYKRCENLRKMLYQHLSRLWSRKIVPLQWRIGESILIPKTDDLTDPAKFRNITKTNTSGKVSMGLLADKMLEYMVSNSYIDTTVQKGFLRKTPGCLEHTQVLMEELKDAKRKRRQIFIVWIDLMNAYGRVPHNLILFAMRHYHFPEELITYMMSYYDELSVRIVTRKWKSNWFFYLIGLFQGDPLSVVLFLIVFNLLLDYLQSKQELGYKPTFSEKSTSNRAFADDLTLLANRLDKMKTQLKMLEDFLEWTRTMKAKPSKCISLGMKVEDGIYCSYDPQLEISGEKVEFIGSKPMKFLGHWIYVNLDDSEVRAMVTTKVAKMLEKIDESSINGVMKCWVYNNMFLHKISWELMIYNFPLTFVKSLDATCTRYLKKWLDVTKSITASVLYRSPDHFGCNFKNMIHLYKSLQVTKGYMLETSKDPKVRGALEHRRKENASKKNWDYTKELSERERDLYFVELAGYIRSTEREGIGYGKCVSRSRKDNLKELIASISEEDLLKTLYDKGKQGQFLSWHNTMQMDIGWQNLIYNYKLSPELLKFHLNSMHDVACTPANLKLWKYSSIGKCELCGWENCNLKHILVFCKYSLNDKRYNWRHDQVLRVLVKPLIEKLVTVNQSQERVTKKNWVSFRSKGTAYQKPKRKIESEPHFLSKTNDWRIMYDEDEAQKNFPQHIVNTSLRPDIVVYSDNIKSVILIELTCGDETNFEDQRARKEERYNGLLAEIEHAGWSAKLFTIEIGCKGFYHDTAPRLFNFFAINRKTKKNALNEAALTALKASYTIWLSRNNKTWCETRNLTERPPKITDELLRCLGPVRHI